MSRKRLSFKVPWSEVECISSADEQECLALARAEFRRQARLRADVEAAQDDAPTRTHAVLGLYRRPWWSSWGAVCVS